MRITDDITIQIIIKPSEDNKQIGFGWFLAHKITKNSKDETYIRCELSVKNAQILNGKTYRLAEIANRSQGCEITERQICGYSRKSYAKHNGKYLELIFTVHIGNGNSISVHSRQEQNIQPILPDNHAQFLHVSPNHKLLLEQSKRLWVCNPYLFEYIIEKLAILMSLVRLSFLITITNNK